VTPLDLPGETAAELEQRLMLFFTGRSHSSGSILAEQTRNSERPSSRTVDHLHAIKDCAEELLAGLKRGCVDGVGDCLHRSWMAKRELAAGISDPWIDRCYETARRSGAAGGKLTGAGGGGFLLLYCEPEHQSRVAVAMESLALSQMDFRFESGGAMVLVNTMYELAASAARV
jgi:D-glycero-alpha-D-manno-heptose-7-phosphate kinase